MDKKENLIETFLAASIKYGEAIESGDQKTLIVNQIL